MKIFDKNNGDKSLNNQAIKKQKKTFFEINDLNVEGDFEPVNDQPKYESLNQNSHFNSNLPHNNHSKFNQPPKNQSDELSSTNHDYLNPHVVNSDYSNSPVVNNDYLNHHVVNNDYSNSPVVNNDYLNPNENNESKKDFLNSSDINNSAKKSANSPLNVIKHKVDNNNLNSKKNLPFGNKLIKLNPWYIGKNLSPKKSLVNGLKKNSSKLPNAKYNDKINNPKLNRAESKLKRDNIRKKQRLKDSIEKNEEEENLNKKKKFNRKKSKSFNALKAIKAGITLAINFVIGIFATVGALMFGIIILIFIILIAISGQIFKYLNTDDEGNIECMNIVQCSNVVIPEGPSAGTYPIDEYIAGAVNYYFGAYNNAEVYKAMGIVINTDLIYYSDIDTTDATCTLNDKTKFNNISIISSSATDNNTEENNSQESVDEVENSNDNLISSSTINSNSEMIIGYSSSIEPNESALNSTSDYKTIIKNYLRVDEIGIENFGIYKICNMHGSSNLAYVDMSVCNNVTIIGGEYPGTYTLDDYIAGVISHEVGGFHDSETFKAFSVAARTYLFTRSQNNDGVCYIESSKNTQVFGPTTDQQIISAVAETSGQIMTDGNGNLISTEYDSFCYESKDDTNYYLAQKHQAIPIEWANEKVPIFCGEKCLKNPCGTDGDGGHGRGMSQYGAYYMSSIEGKKYDEILSFYYDTGTLSTTIKTDSITAEQNSYGLIYPLESTGNCTSQFGSRIHPITGEQKNHGGIDIARAKDTPIYAAEDGVVAVNGYDADGWGNYVKITGNNGLDTLYAHMDKQSTLRVGQTITAGTLIGYVGQTGAATGYHLHFEIYENGTRVDPLNYLPGLCG